MKNKIKNAVESQQTRTTNRIYKTKYRVSNKGGDCKDDQKS